MNQQMTRRSITRGLTVAALVALGLGAAAAPASADAFHSASAGRGHAANTRTDCKVPAIVTRWAAAWNGSDPAALAALFTADGVYIDNGVGKTSTGREEIANWKVQTDYLISGVQIKVLGAVQKGNTITIRSRYSGHIVGAPTAFSLSASTTLVLRHGKIVSNTDNYSGAELLAQSGLPADWTPTA